MQTLITISFYIILIFLLVMFFKQKNLLSPTSIFYGYSSIVFPISYLLSSYLSLGSVFFKNPSEINSNSIFEAIFSITLAFLSFSFARYLIPIRKVVWVDYKIKRVRILVAVLLSLLISAVAANLLFTKLGGFQRVIAELGAVRSGELNGLGIYTYAITMLLPTVLQFYLIYSIKNKSKNLAYVLAVCILSCFLGGVFGFRGPVVSLLIQVYCIFFIMTGKPKKKITFRLILFAIPISTLAGLLRFSLNENFYKYLDSIDLSILIGTISDWVLTRVRGVETFVILKNYVDVHGYNFFIQSIIESFTVLIPNILYTKATSLTEIIATKVYGLYLYDAGIFKDIYGGVSYTFISEAYWNFGYFGIVIFCFILGLTLKSVEQNAEVNKSVVQLIFFKAFSGFSLLMVETPQLAINAIILNIALNLLMLMFLSITIFPKSFNR